MCSLYRTCNVMPVVSQFPTLSGSKISIKFRLAVLLGNSLRIKIMLYWVSLSSLSWFSLNHKIPSPSPCRQVWASKFSQILHFKWDSIVKYCSLYLTTRKKSTAPLKRTSSTQVSATRWSARASKSWTVPRLLNSSSWILFITCTRSEIQLGHWSAHCRLHELTRESLQSLWRSRFRVKKHPIQFQNTQFVHQQLVANKPINRRHSWHEFTWGHPRSSFVWCV